LSLQANAIFAGETPNAVKRGEALPWSLIAAGLAAMAALYFSADRFVGLPVLGVVMVLSRFTTRRLPRSFIITYGSRAVILAVLLTLINQTDVQDVTVWYLKQADTNLAGYALAADIVLRAWERRGAAGAREGLGVVVLMTALLFAAATNTYERLHIQLITPIYAIFLLLSFRCFALMTQPAGSRHAVRGGLVALRAIVVLFTLGFAFGAVYAVTRYEYQVTSWAMQFVRQRHEAQHEIGFAASAHLSTIFNPEPVNARVLLVEGQLPDPHLRVAALDTYAHEQWLPGTQNFSPFSTSAGQLADASAHRLRFTRMADTADLLAVPLQTEALTCEDPLEEDESGTLRDTRSGSESPYAVLASPSPVFQGPLAVSPDAPLRQELLSIPPEIDPRVLELAKRVAGEGKLAIRVMRLQEYLRSHYRYSLSFSPQGEPLNDFILHHRAAHCQYFASAIVMMARAIGVPARYVGGFYAHEPYADGELVVRQRDAHAWAECWLDGTGWITVDATPAGGRPDGRFADPPTWKRWWEKLRDLPGQIRDWLEANKSLLMKLAGLGAIIWTVVWLARWLIRRPRRVKTATSAYSGASAQLLELAKRYERWLKQRGTPCPPEATWRSQLTMLDDEQSRLLQMFVRTYDRARFGADTEDSSASACELLDRIERGDNVPSTARPDQEIV
jgi:transglutaminase-like putative cysteine protease